MTALPAIETPAVIGYGQAVWDALDAHPDGLDRDDLMDETGLTAGQLGWGLQECRLHRSRPGKRSLVYVWADNLYLLQSSADVTNKYALWRLRGLHTGSAVTRLSLQATAHGKSAAAHMSRALAHGAETMEAWAAYELTKASETAVTLPGRKIVVGDEEAAASNGTTS